MSDWPPLSEKIAIQAWRNGEISAATRAVPSEIPVALTYNHQTYAVMMATPGDMRDFAIGFSLSEAIIAHPSEIIRLDIVAVTQGIECRMELAPERMEALQSRRRRMAGPVGCGLCGIESLSEAARPIPLVVSQLRVAAPRIAQALRQMALGQTLNQETRAVHAAGFFEPASGRVLVREDVGRHNALDKLIGAMAEAGLTGGQGVMLLTSRVSIELIQKAAISACSILVAVSVPSAYAITEARAAGITLCAVARDDGFEIFTHPARILFESNEDVA